MHRLSSTITKKTVDQWRSDLRRMTKIYRDVPTDVLDERWTEARRLFGAFGRRWETWVYKELLPYVKKGEESWLAKQVREKAWAAHTVGFSDLFPAVWSYTTQTHEPSPWKMGQEREKNIRRYQRAFIDAFDAIEQYLDQTEGSVERRTYEETLDVAGVNVVFRNWGRKDTDEEQVDPFLRYLRTGLTQIAHAGFPSAYRGMTLFVDFDRVKSEHLIAGEYTPSTDSLSVFGYGINTDYSTLTHEIGHRFWYREMSPNARAAWEEALTGATVKVTETDVDVFYDRVVQPLIHNGFAPSRTEMLERIEKTSPTEADRVKWEEMTDTPTTLWAERTFDPDTYKARLQKFNVGVNLHLEPITEYARTSPTEAFADAFRLWVLKGPGALGPWTREFFKKVVRTGGAKVASQVLWRFALISEYPMRGS